MSSVRLVSFNESDDNQPITFCHAPSLWLGRWNYKQLAELECWRCCFTAAAPLQITQGRLEFPFSAGRCQQRPGSLSGLVYQDSSGSVSFSLYASGNGTDSTSLADFDCFQYEPKGGR